MKSTTVLIVALVAGLGTLAAAPAFADEAGMPRVDQRQAQQKQRIQDGIASGALTRPEAHGLVHGQRQIAHAERRALADGTVTKRESAQLHLMQDRTSRQIARQKHDGQTRP